MVDWTRDFPNLTREQRALYKNKYDKARTAREKQRVLQNAKNEIMRFNSDSETTLRQNRTRAGFQATRKKVVNVAKRAVAKMPTSEQMLDLGWRLGKKIYDNPRGVEMFADIMLLLTVRRKNVPQKMVEATRRALPPLDILAENTSKRLQRVYAMRSSFIGDIIKFDALLHSDDITKFVSESFVFLFTFGIVLRLLVIGTDRSRKMVTDVLDTVVSFIKLPGFTFYALSAETLLNSIVAMHVRLFLAKITNVVVNKYVPSFLSTIIKNVVNWANNKVDLSKYVGKLGGRLVVGLLAAIIDMKYAPKSIVKQSYKVIDMFMLKQSENTAGDGAKSIAYTTTPQGSGNQEAQSPARPTRVATVEGEGVSPMRIRARGNDGQQYIFSMSVWNALSENNRIPSSSNDPVVRLTYKGQVRYARRSGLFRR